MPFERLHVERGLLLSARYMAFFGVLGSLAGSLLMFILGLTNVLHAYLRWWPGHSSEDDLPASSVAIISVIEALDRFLIAIVLLYFANGVYVLFIRRQQDTSGAPFAGWAQVGSIGQLKQVVAEVIIVVLFVLFLRVALEIYREPEALPSWRKLGFVLLLPASTLMLALALKLVELHPKPRPMKTVEDPKRARDKNSPDQVSPTEKSTSNEPQD